MLIIFRLIRFILPLLLMYLVFQVLWNFLYYFVSSGYPGRRSSYSGGTGDSRSQNRGGTSRRTRDPYLILGCSPHASDEEVKSCYRRMVGRYHPDRFIGQELDQEFIDLATERFKEIQDAYDHIRKIRGMV